jgi:hypothetical protein
MFSDGNEDDTIVLRRERLACRPHRLKMIIGSVAVGALIIALVGFFILRGHGGVAIDTETEAQIDATQPCTIKVSRLAQDQNIVVIDFPDLRAQGLMLDRVAALVEKAHLPRDRVLGDVELNQAIYACGETIESYYYGHDYKAADLARFFSLAAAERIQLNSQELWLKGLLTQLGWLSPGANGALITLPGAVAPVTEEMRAVILHHEISHGAFYTMPDYAAYADGFWASLTDDQRASFRSFLGAGGYDTGNEILMLNETQAYLIFTRDPQFFSGAVVNMNDAQIDALQARYVAGMPTSWLTPIANETLPVGPAPSACQVNG